MSSLVPSRTMSRPSSSRRSLSRVAISRVALLGAALFFTWMPASDLGAQRDRDRDRDRDREDDRSSEQRRDNAFSWSGTIPNGRRIMIKSLNGGIEVLRSTSGRVEVTAEKRWRRGNPDDVRIEQRKLGDEVLICAMWNEQSRCEESGIQTPRNTRWNDRNDVSVRFVVRVPEGVRVDVETVNGGLSVNGVTTDVRAKTVNGSIDARSAGGPVRAVTVNGSIHVSMGSMGNADDLEYETVNGSVTVELPSNFGAQLELSTVNGRVSTDFPITVGYVVAAPAAWHRGQWQHALPRIDGERQRESPPHLSKAKGRKPKAESQRPKATGRKPKAWISNDERHALNNMNAWRFRVWPSAFGVRLSTPVPRSPSPARSLSR